MQARAAELEKGKAGGGGKHTDLTHSLTFSDHTNQAKKRAVSKVVNGLVRALVTASSDQFLTAQAIYDGVLNGMRNWPDSGHQKAKTGSAVPVLSSKKRKKCRGMALWT